MGSKNRISKHILPIILQDREPEQWYVEPFVGGGNVIDKVTGNRIGGELNKYVADLLIKISEGWLPPQKVTEEEWTHVKNNKDEYPLYYVGYCGVCLSFGSVWFCAFARDAKGNRNYAEESFRNLSKQAPKLKGIQFHCSDYRDLNIPPRSIIYCDPPYKGTDKYRGFEQIDHDIFWDWCREMVFQKHKVYISEFQAPDDFVQVWQTVVNTQMAEKALGKNVVEKLFIHKDQFKLF